MLSERNVCDMINQPMTESEKIGGGSKKKLYFCLMLFGIIGIALSVFMGYCQISHTQLVQISSEPVNVLSYSDNMPATSRILTYFDNSPMVTVLHWSCFLAVIAAMVIPVFSVKINLRGDTPNSIFTVFASSLLGFMFAGYVVNFILIPLRHLWTKVQLPGPDFSVMTPLLKIIFIGGIFIAVPCAVYFLLIATQHRFTQNRNMCILSVFPVIWLSFRLVFYFMSTSAHVNIAGRKLFILSLVFAIIFFVQDSKRWIPKAESQEESAEAKRNSILYLASGFASLVTFSVYHLSTTFLQAFWMIEAEDTYILNGIFIAMILFIAFRLASVKVSDK